MELTVRVDEDNLDDLGKAADGAQEPHLHGLGHRV
jgi:hypothetical protein